MAARSIVPSTAAPERPARSRARALRVRAERRPGTVFISGEALAAAVQLATRRELIDRLFSLPALRAVRIDPARGAAALTFEAEELSIPDALEALAVTLRAKNPHHFELPHDELLVTRWAEQPFSVWRAERGLTLWQVEELHAGHFRLTHPLLEHRAIREKVLDAIATIAGVSRQVAPLIRSSSIEVWCQPHRVNEDILLEAIEPALTDYQSLIASQGFSLRPKIVAANLLLAPISDYLLPQLKIFNAVMVWLLNAEHLPAAWRAVRERRGNLELLYLTIGALTLLTFHFLGSAIMYAMLEMWPRLVRRIPSEGQRQFLARYQRRPPRVWLEREGTLLETPLKELPAGEVMTLRAGDTVPGDGVVLDGRAEVRESWITGATGPIHKDAGDPLYASTILSDGEVRMRIDSTGDRTIASRLASWYSQALRQPSLQSKAEKFADSMVLPALVFGLAALGRGGLDMTKAVMRPDYFTGPAIAEELSELLAVIQAADAGFYVANQEALDRLAEADCWIFDDSVAWTRRARNGTGFAEKLREQGVREVLFLSSQSTAETAGTAMNLGFDVHQANFAPEGVRHFIAQRQFLGQSVAYFGDCARRPIVAEQANIAVNILSNNHPLTSPGGPIALLIPDLARCSVLYSLSCARASSVSSAFLASAVPNVAALSGAIYLEFPVIVSVILTNLGTLASYYRWRRTLLSAQ
jgi:hypothetical protein